MSLAGGWDRRGGRSGRLAELPRQQPPVVFDVGCNCRGPRLLSSLISALKAHARGVVGGTPKSPHASSSSWSSSTTTTTTAFTSSVSTTTATSASSAAADLHSWGPATYATTTNADTLYLYDDDADEHVRRQRRQRRRRSSRCIRKGQQGRMATSAALGEETAEAVAVEVESAAPYEDFRESMVAMVTEKEMYAWEDLNALLHQFLALNSPRHHPLILTAFADLWAPRGGLFCPPSPCLL